MWNGSRQAASGADKDEEESAATFLPSRLFEKKQGRQDVACLAKIRSPPPPSNTPLSELVFHKNTLVESSSRASPSPSKRTFKSSSLKTHLYRDLSRSALPTTRGRQKVLLDTKRTSCSKTLLVETQRETSNANMANRFEEDVRIVRDYHKAREQRLLLDQTTRLVSWLYMQDKHQDEESAVRDFKDRQHVVAPFDDLPALPDTSSWAVQGDTEYPLNEEDQENCKQNVAAPHAPQENQAAREQSLLTTETLRLVSWLSEQERLRQSTLATKEEPNEEILREKLSTQSGTSFKTKARADADKDTAITKAAQSRVSQGTFLVVGRDPPNTPTYRKGNICTSAEEVTVFVTPSTTSYQGGQQTEPLTLNTRGRVTCSPLTVTPAAMTPTAPNADVFKHVVTPRSLSSQLALPDETQRPLVQPSDEPPISATDRIYGLSSTSCNTSRNRCLPILSTAGRDLGGMYVVTPQVISANGVQYKCSGKVVNRRPTRMIRNNQERRSRGSLQHPRGRMVVSSRRADHHSVDLDETDGNSSDCTCVSGMEGPRVVNKDRFCVPSSSAVFPQNDEAYLHALKAGTCWQTLIGQHVCFPKTWWNGARVPEMGADNFLPDGTIPQHYQWKYISLDPCSNPALASLVSDPSSKGRLLLHIIVRDEMWKPVQDIVIGCYYPRCPLNTTGLATEKGNVRLVWMGIRNRSDHVKTSSRAAIDSILVSDDDEDLECSTLLSPLGNGRPLDNSDLRPVFGDEPPKETLFILESELAKRVQSARKSSRISTISICLLELFLDSSSRTRGACHGSL